MSFDNVGGTTLLLDNQVLSCVGDTIALVGDGPQLADALALSNVTPKDGGAILQPGDDASDLDDDLLPAFSTYEPDMPVDDGGGGYIEVYEPTIYVPEGFVADDLYAVEFILDASTGVLTINLLFSTDPLDHQMAVSASLNSFGTATDALTMDLGVGDILPTQAGQAAGSKCTVTITKTTSTTSPSSTVSLFGGIWGHSTGSTTETTTRTVTVEGRLVNGRCVATTERH